MKRLICGLLTLLLLTMSGCAASEVPIQEPAQFYYQVLSPSYKNGSAMIEAETHEASGCGGNLMYLIERYLKGPHSDRLKLPLPGDGSTVYPISVHEEEGRIRLHLSPGFAKLTGIDLTLASSCLAMTLLSYTDADSVEISAENSLLDGSDSIVMTRDCFVLVDESSTLPDETK